MRVRDPLYGEFDLPQFLAYLVETPEFRRLSEVRLLNINSVSLAALADATRYSHTLGVLRLALNNPLLGFSEAEHKALLAAIIIHDSGTPAFAHLFEYFLNDRSNWSHETVLSDILRKQSHVDGKFQQFFHSQVPRFEAACRKAHVSFDLVREIVSGEHPLSQLVFGSLDFDNLDNVYRMAFMLGLKVDVDSVLVLARNLGLTSEGNLVLDQEYEGHVSTWSKLRRSAYEILVFDEKTVAGQAVLSRVISEALSASELSEQDWSYTDNALIEAICKSSPEGKLRLERDFYSRLPQLCLVAQVFQPTDRLLKMSRDELAREIETYLLRYYPSNGLYGYAMKDVGTFEKSLTFHSPHSGNKWTYGQKSQSLVFYGFTRSARLKAEPLKMGNEFLKVLNTNE